MQVCSSGEDSGNEGLVQQVVFSPSTWGRRAGLKDRRPQPCCYHCGKLGHVVHHCPGAHHCPLGCSLRQHPSPFPTVKLQWGSTVSELSYPLPPNHHRLSSRNWGSSEETHRAMEELCRWSGVGLSPTQKHQLQGLLEESCDIFAACDDACTQTHLVKHEIDTGDAHPVHCWLQ